VVGKRESRERERERERRLFLLWTWGVGYYWGESEKGEKKNGKRK